MVIDTLENLEKYVSLNPLFNDVVDFLKSNDLNKLSEGKHLIKGTDLFVNMHSCSHLEFSPLQVLHETPSCSGSSSSPLR